MRVTTTFSSIDVQVAGSSHLALFEALFQVEIQILESISKTNNVCHVLINILIFSSVFKILVGSLYEHGSSLIAGRFWLSWLLYEIMNFPDCPDRYNDLADIQMAN